MQLAFSVHKEDSIFAVRVKNKPLMTPGKKPMEVSTEALAEAIVTEWQVHQKFVPSQMPLTSLAYTAIDRIAGNEEAIVEALMAYVDTDTLSYRSTSSQKLAELQQEKWDPILSWAGKQFSGIWQITTGIMPLEQPQAVHEAIRNYLRTLNPMQLSAACMLASGFSSIVLAVAVLEKRLNAEEAFYLSRLEEEVQAEQWGRDEEAEQRKQRLQVEILGFGRFLSLLNKG